MGRFQERQATRVSWASRTNNAAVATHTHSKPCIIEVQITHHDHIFWAHRFIDVPYLVPILINFGFFEKHASSPKLFLSSANKGGCSGDLLYIGTKWLFFCQSPLRPLAPTCCPHTKTQQWRDAINCSVHDGGDEIFILRFGEFTLRHYILRIVYIENCSHWGWFPLRFSHWDWFTLRFVHIEIGSHWGLFNTDVYDCRCFKVLIIHQIHNIKYIY